MCTAVYLKTDDLYFGRNLDLEYTYKESVTVMPRNYPLFFAPETGRSSVPNHHAVIGMAYTPDDYPLFYDATNEKGLSMAGLNFPGYAVYHDKMQSRHNIRPFEFIPWILCQCATVKEAKHLISTTNLVNIPYSESLPNTPLHWMIAGHDGAIVVEPREDGLVVHDNPVGILTNSPTFDWHMLNLSRYMMLSPQPAENRIAKSAALNSFSRGMGTEGLPGGFSSSSRFVKAAFARLNSVSGTGECESVSQMFHILGTVAHPRGCVLTDDTHFEITQYTSCCNASKGVYYYTTYDNSRITAVSMHHTDLNGTSLIHYSLRRACDVLYEN